MSIKNLITEGIGADPGSIGPFILVGLIGLPLYVPVPNKAYYMNPGILNLTIIQGSTFCRIIRLTDSATPAVPIDLTDAVARMHIRETLLDANPIIELNGTNGRAVVSDGINGEITLLIVDEDTAKLDFTKAVYDLEIEYSNGRVDRVLKGKVSLDKEVTR